MSKTINKVGIILTLLLCALLTNIDTFIPQIQDYINISTNIMAQITAVMLIVFMLWFYKNLTKKIRLEYKKITYMTNNKGHIFLKKEIFVRGN